MTLRVVFDTSTVLSSLLFPQDRLAWLRAHWRSGACTPIAARDTIAELSRVLSYPKFHLRAEDAHELLAEYLPFCEFEQKFKRAPLLCRDRHDQIFLDLAYSARAGVLVSSDSDLLSLKASARFAIETPEQYRSRFQT